MATVLTTYLGELRTESIHLSSGTRIITDAPTDNRGKGESFSPTDMLVTSVGTCILTIMGIKAMDNNLDIRGTKLEITKIMASDPRRVSEVVMNFYFPAGNFSNEEKKIIESGANLSPVPISVSKDIKQTIKFNW